MRLMLFILWCSMVPSLAWAHHSVAGVYDPDQVIEVEGQVTRVFWRNPHVRFWIRDDSGDTWEVEGGALRWLERGGVTRDLFVEGEQIRAAGNPARRTANQLVAHNILLPDGRETLMSGSASPRWSNRTLAFRFAAEADPSVANERASGIFRVWSRPGSRQEWNVSLTEVALAARSQWEAIRDDPTLRCVAPGMVEAMTSPYPIEFIQDGEDIIIRMEEWDGTRRIHMDATGSADGAPESLMGYSAGNWEGNTLVVSTSRINWPYLDSLGTPQSEEVTMVERFSVSADEARMIWEAVITDPVNLTEPATVQQEYEWVPGVEIQEYNCALPDEVR